MSAFCCVVDVNMQQFFLSSFDKKKYLKTVVFMMYSTLVVIVVDA